MVYLVCARNNSSLASNVSLLICPIFTASCGVCQAESVTVGMFSAELRPVPPGSLWRLNP
jgi:hypothetical protein